MGYRLLALDADGTILDPSGELRPAVQQAVSAAQQRGLQVVLCTGRRFRTALPLAQALQLTTPLVVHNGALVKEQHSGITLYQTDLPTHVYRQALTFLRQHGLPMVYVDAFHKQVDIITEDPQGAHPFQREYLEDHLAYCRIVDDIHTPPAYSVLMLSIMAEESTLRPLQSHMAEALGHRVRIIMLINKTYQGHILEVLHPTVSKWTALQQLAARQGIMPADIMAVGDDDNDIDMLRHAGLGIAMGNARERVKAVADHVTGSNAEDGLVQAIERFVLRR
ncbi:Sugar phosphatase YidA [Candidatus Entotheonellaceae bacterium PAL068K]